MPADMHYILGVIRAISDTGVVVQRYSPDPTEFVETVVLLLDPGVDTRMLYTDMHRAFERSPDATWQFVYRTVNAYNVIVSAIPWSYDAIVPARRQRPKRVKELPTRKGFSVDTLMVLEDMQDDIAELIHEGKMNAKTKKVLTAALSRLADVIKSESATPKKARPRRQRVVVASAPEPCYAWMPRPEAAEILSEPEPNVNYNNFAHILPHNGEPVVTP